MPGPNIGRLSRPALLKKIVFETYLPGFTGFAFLFWLEKRHVYVWIRFSARDGWSLISSKSDNISLQRENKKKGKFMALEAKESHQIEKNSIQKIADIVSQTCGNSSLNSAGSDNLRHFRAACRAFRKRNSNRTYLRHRKWFHATLKQSVQKELCKYLPLHIN